MSKYLRANLVFKKDNIREMKAYKILFNQRNKSDYIVDAIHFYEENRIEISRQGLKAIIEEILKDSKYTISDDKNNEVNAEYITDELEGFFDNFSLK